MPKYFVNPSFLEGVKASVEKLESEAEFVKSAAEKSGNTKTKDRFWDGLQVAISVLNAYLNEKEDEYLNDIELEDEELIL